MPMTSETALESRARRAANRIGLRARKSRRRANPYDNRGGFQILNDNWIVAGEKFNLSPEDVIEYCDWAAANRA